MKGLGLGEGEGRAEGMRGGERGWVNRIRDKKKGGRYN